MFNRGWIRAGVSVRSVRRERGRIEGERARARTAWPSPRHPHPPAKRPTLEYMSPFSHT